MEQTDVNRLAVAICRNLGLDPNETINGDAYTGLTMTERIGLHGKAVPDVLIVTRRWETFRYQAEMALAADRAMRELRDEPLTKPAEPAQT